MAVPAEVKTQVMKHAALLDVDLLCILDRMDHLHLHLTLVDDKFGNFASFIVMS